MTFCERFAKLARLDGGSPPVVSVDLDTRRIDEGKRDRARVRLKSTINQARTAGAAVPEDLDWIATEKRSVAAATRHS